MWQKRLACAAGAPFIAATVIAGVVLQPGTEVEFATVTEGRTVLGTRDDFVQAMSQLDRCLRMRTTNLVTLTHGFWMGRFEVTQGEYEEVMSSNPSFFAGTWSRPVEQVSWHDAAAYCGQLTLREQAAGRLPVGYAFRLPTEAEWEYAARAGSTWRFNYGDDPTYVESYRRFWFVDNDNMSTRPVGLRPPNAWGFHDMHGNVMEWCLDWYGTYPGGAVTDPQGPASGSQRICRGGGWSNSPRNCRTAYRFSLSPTNAHSAVGFRVVLAPASP